MAELGVSDENVFEEREYKGFSRDVLTELVDVVCTSPSHTDPQVIVDGIDRIKVYSHPDEGFIIGFFGFMARDMYVSREGLLEFSEDTLGDIEGFPEWYIQDYEGDSLPDWVPDSYNPKENLECTNCGDEVSPTEMVTPRGGRERDRSTWVCRDCWESEDKGQFMVG
ncbi:MAG: hypothetical protein ABEK59_11985 [Halobacteria archaeon]